MRNVLLSPAHAFGARFPFAVSPALIEFFRYGLASGLALAVDWGLLIILTERLGLPYAASGAISFCVGAVVAYACCVRFVFPSRTVTDHRYGFAVFLFVGCLGLVLTVALLPVVIAFTGLSYALAKGPVACVVFLFNFAVRRIVLFSNEGAARSGRPWQAIGDSVEPGPRFWNAMLLVSAAAIWALYRPYLGVLQDGMLYVGRGLADLDPNGVGRDMMFVYDGQSAFSVFGTLLDRLIVQVGFSNASLLLAAFSAASFFTAMVFFARCLAQGAERWAVLVFLAVLPCVYGGYNCMHYGEALAIPRCFSAALVIGALVAIIDRRLVLCGACLVVAILFHPITGLIGVAGIVLFLCLENPRWLIVPVLGVAGAVIAALLRLPVAQNLFVLIDPAWRHVLDVHCPYLFPSAWTADVWDRQAVQTATVVIASAMVSPRLRNALLANVIIAWAGIATAFVFGDWIPSLLVTQVQPWRAAWLLSFTSNAVLPVVLLGLCRQQSGQRIVAAMLAIAWVVPNDVNLAFVPALFALGLHVFGRTATLPIRPWVEKAIWAVAALVACLALVPQTELLVAMLRAKPAEAPMPFAFAVNLVPVSIPLCAAVVAFVLWEKRLRGRWAPLAVTLLCVGLVVAAARAWDDRTEDLRYMDMGAQPADLNALIAGKSGEVLWLDGFASAPWMLLHRANWVTELQAAGSVFSRPLSLEWFERTRRVLAAKLANRSLQDPFRNFALKNILPVLSKDRIEAFCRPEDAPAWLVAPIEHDAAVPRGVEAKIWQAPFAAWQPQVTEAGVGWQRVTRYAVVPCHR